MPADEVEGRRARTSAGADLVITSYGFLPRMPWLATTPWRLVVLDEAQAIKNPGAKQTTAVKQLRAEARIALTGTPIENRLGDLWSIFDFINPGLLGVGEAVFGLRQAARRRGRTIPTVRSASSCGPTSCAA